MIRDSFGCQRNGTLSWGKWGRWVPPLRRFLQLERLLRLAFFAAEARCGALALLGALHNLSNNAPVEPGAFRGGGTRVSSSSRPRSMAERRTSARLWRCGSASCLAIEGALEAVALFKAEGPFWLALSRAEVNKLLSAA